MKYLFTLLISLFFSVVIFAQAPMKTTVEYNGQKYPCYITEYNLPPDDMENVIKEKLKLEGYNPAKSKGFLVYRSVRLRELNSDEPQDVFFKVERKSRRENDQSLVTMITSKAGEISENKVKGAKTVADIESSSNSVSFLSSFRGNVDIQAHNLAVSAQTDEVAKAEKKLKNLEDAQVKLEKKIKESQNDLEVNKKDQQQQTYEIAKQKAVLDQLKTQSDKQ